MYSVLIVEDEMLVSIGLKNMIDWSKLDMKVIAEAQNGAAAWEIYQKEQPDLILTDIKMPVMDGLQLIAKIREKDSKTKIIILTCYQEFDLLYQALIMNVSDYILKLKMSVDDMEAVIHRVHDELEAENRNRKTSLAHDVDRQTLRDRIVKDYILQQNISVQDFEKILSQLQLRLTPRELVICFMKISLRQIDESSENHDQATSDAIMHILNDLFARFNRGEAFERGFGQYLLIFSQPAGSGESSAPASLNEILDRIKTMMAAYVNADVVFGISSQRDQYTSLPILCDEAAKALKHGFFSGDSRKIHYDDKAADAEYQSLLDSLREKIEKMPDIDMNYRKEISEGIALLAQRTIRRESAAQEIVLRWIYWPSVDIGQYGERIVSLAYEYAGQIRSCLTFADCVRVFEQYLAELAKSRLSAKVVGREIAEAIRFIRQHYAQELTLQQVAGEAEISANYLSSLFRKELNIGFSDYVNSVRIDQAKRLLMNSHNKIYDIAEQVGFVDESYFSRIFKRITGLRPLEYRRQNIIYLEDGCDKGDLR